MTAEHVHTKRSWDVGRLATRTGELHLLGADGRWLRNHYGLGRAPRAAHIQESPYVGDARDWFPEAEEKKTNG